MSQEISRITQTILGGAVSVHKALGPGLLESAYELVERGLQVERQKGLPVRYREVNLDCGYRIDLLVEGKVIVEVKAVDKRPSFCLI